MDGDSDLKERWARVLARTGAAGHAWRKSLVARLASQLNAAEIAAADPATLKAAIKSERALRASGHWAFRPERLRRLLALYLRAMALRRDRAG